MDRVSFYSENDIACGWELDKVIDRINDHSVDKDWRINDVLEFHNILKYLKVERFVEYLEEETCFDSVEYTKKVNAKIGKYIGIKKASVLRVFDEIEFLGTKDFLELIDKYGVYKEISSSDFEAFLGKDNVPLYMVLKHKKIVMYFDDIVKNKIMSNPFNAEVVLSKHIEDKNLNLPPSLKEKDMLKLIGEYIDLDTERVNINVLRKIIHFPASDGLKMTDKLRLSATRKEKEESEKIFNQGTGIESSVSIKYEKGLDEVIKFDTEGSATEASIVVNRDWIEENKDYPTLWNNFIHLFGITDLSARLTMVSKKNEGGTVSSLFLPSGSHLYRNTFTFGFKEMVANAQLYSYIEVLNALGINIENMIEWFFSDYLKDEFSIDDFVVKLPSESSSYFEKCRTILPEIDRILKQYNVLIEDGSIDQELIQISSSSVKVNEVESFISRKYVYPIGGWYETASFLLFSDQSSIFYIPKKEEKYKNYIELIVRDNVTKADFQEYQLQRMQWLFDEKLIFENEDGYIKILDSMTLFILKELYYEDVLNYYHHDVELRKTIDKFEEKGIVKIECSLLTLNEQDYFDFYMNKSKFTNGYDIRNRYLHGTNGNDENQYKNDYYLILKLIIIIVLKINDDLCLMDEKKL
ncbi:MAG: hypothetical protein N4A76_08635 [Firmicutes bacterium]|jgi:hypothetical protein|nr:hypothetical protein [Bacillota bacterium]